MRALLQRPVPLNPFRYQGNFQKYFMGTGDYIKGISFDTSTTNAVINAFGVLYFLNRKNAAMTIACMFTLLLTASNITNLLLCCAFRLSFYFLQHQSSKKHYGCLLYADHRFLCQKFRPKITGTSGRQFNRFFKKQPSGQLTSSG
jgi:hypothetical protein